MKILIVLLGVFLIATSLYSFGVLSGIDSSSDFESGYLLGKGVIAIVGVALLVVGLRIKKKD